MKIVILAGGSGTRLWPASRAGAPKQIISLIGQKTLLQQTYERMLKKFPRRDIFISINKKQQAIVKKQLTGLKQKQLIIEPLAKNTAAAIGLAALKLSLANPREVIATVNSDHFIKEEEKFLKVLKTAGQAVKKDYQNFYLLGLKPAYPETGYGYIQIGQKFKQLNGLPFHKVVSFKEKPDVRTASRYVKNRKYLWNPGCFIFRADHLLSLYKTWAPQIYSSLMAIKKRPSGILAEFKKMDSISIDYAIIEKAKNIVCLYADFAWADIGHWRTVKEVLSLPRQDHLIKGEYLGLDSSDNLIYGLEKKLVTTIGLHEYIIIDTKDCLLICPKDRAHDVKKLVETLKNKGLKRYL